MKMVIHIHQEVSMVKNQLVSQLGLTEESSRILNLELTEKA